MRKTLTIEKMDSLKIPKGGNSGASGNKSPGNVPITVRFNAGEESLDDIFQSFHNNSTNNSGCGGGDSLSNSPSQQAMHQQNVDEANTRNNFLQGSFFNRKRSGSCEGSSPVSLGPNLTTAVASGADTNSVGTWQLIKGKVSQTIEDIKASKGSNQTLTAAKGDLQETDLDWEEIATIQSSSTGDELSLQQKTDLDSEVECEQNYEAAGGDRERSCLRRRLSNLKSKVKANTPPSSQQHNFSPKISSAASSATPTRSMDKDVSRRGQTPVGRGEVRTVSHNKPQEIESGVEMREGMLPNEPEKKPTKVPRTFLKPDAETKVNSSGLSLRNVPENKKSLGVSQFIKGFFSRGTNVVGKSTYYIPYCSILGLVLVMTLSMPDFLRGVLACLLTSSLLSSSWKPLLEIITHASPERSEFAIPDFSKTSIIQIPVVEEHKTVKSYSGWMNEIHSYDPDDYHVSMTESVYVKLDGTILSVSNTTARIPKRLLWNQKPVDLSTIQFTQHRTYDLLGCRVEMLPVGLAHKRFFNRKYPIQLIIKNPCLVNTIESVNQETDSEHFFDVRDSDISLLSFLGQDDRDRMSAIKMESAMDFGSTIMNANLQSLQNVEPSNINRLSVPCGDEMRLLLFSRGAREKEDWYRRFIAASRGDVNDQELQLPNVFFVNDSNMQTAAVNAALQSTGNTGTRNTPNADAPEGGSNLREDYSEPDNVSENAFEGLVLSSCAARNPVNYIRFMAMYQKACNKTTIPVYRVPLGPKKSSRKNFRRVKRAEDELWKGIDQSLYLGPSGSVVWFNVIIGRFIYSLLNERSLQVKVHELIQKKINTIKLPSFMEDVIITQVNLGDKPPLIHRTSQAMLDERGIWVDADVTYEGLVYFTVSTKLNLMRLKRQASRLESNLQTNAPAEGTPFNPSAVTLNLIPDFERIISSHSQFQLDKRLSGGVIYDSDAESMGSSSSESEELEADAPTPSMASPSPSVSGLSANAGDMRTPEPNVARTQQMFRKNPHKILKIVDRFAASNFFQYATELPYVQRAIENMNANITLRLEIRGMVARVVLNLPPPPSDRMWIGFRGPPRLWIQAKPAFGEKSVDWSFLTSVIESKICEQINKMMVYPNMADISINFLGPSTYQDQNC